MRPLRGLQETRVATRDLAKPLGTGSTHKAQRRHKQKAATARDGGDQGRSGISEPYKLTRKEPEATPEQGGCSAGDGCLGWVGSSEAVSVHAGKGHTRVFMAAETETGSWGCREPQERPSPSLPPTLLPPGPHLPQGTNVQCRVLALVAQSRVSKDLELRQHFNTLHTECSEK